MNDEKKKRGRPIVGDVKNKQVHIRTTGSVFDMMDEICKSQGLSKTQLFEKMVRTQYNLLNIDYDFDDFNA